MITIKSITKTCSACPSQWKGWTIDNRQVYVRYRWGYLSIRIGAIDDLIDGAATTGIEIFGKRAGDGLDGALEYAKLLELTKGNIAWPELEETNVGN